MSKFIKVEGHSNLVRDTYSNGIVNTNVSEYQIYMQRVKNREKQGDQIRNAVKEINTLITLHPSAVFNNFITFSKN